LDGQKLAENSKYRLTSTSLDKNVTYVSTLFKIVILENFNFK